jgi:hypothetical protein
MRFYLMFANFFIFRCLTRCGSSEKKLRVISAAFAQKLDAAFEVGASLSYNRDVASAPKKEGETAASPYKFTVGTAYRVDGTTSKAKIDTAGDLVGSFSAPVKGNATVTLVGKVNVLSSGKPAGVGLQIALK